MIEFETLVYLDLQKTATTSIETLLRHYVDEREQVHGGHTSPKTGHDRSKFHFVSVREPSAIYRSMFLYGCGKKGGLFTSFRRADMDHLYQPTTANFHAWLDIMLDPKKVQGLWNRVTGMGAQEHCSMVTQMLFLVSVVNPAKKFGGRTFASRQEIRDFYDHHRLFRHYVRMEHIVHDLFATLTAPECRAPFSPPLTDVEDLRARLPVRNRSAKVGTVHSDPIPDELLQRIRDREWLIYDLFGYGSAPKGAPPPLPVPGWVTSRGADSLGKGRVEQQPA